MDITLDSTIKGTQVIKDGVTYTIKEVQVAQGGAITTVWKSATPYTPILNSVAWDFSTPNQYSHGFQYSATASRVYLSVHQNDGVIEYGQAYYSATFNTQGCDKVRIKAEINNPIHADMTINGKAITSNGSYEFDCSGDTFKITMYINTGGVDWASADLSIAEIYFHD